MLRLTPVQPPITVITKNNDMTKLQKMALEHVDGLLIDAHNDANGMDEEKEGHNMSMRAAELRDNINKIQIWCRVICNDPQS